MLKMDGVDKKMKEQHLAKICETTTRNIFNTIENKKENPSNPNRNNYYRI